MIFFRVKPEPIPEEKPRVCSSKEAGILISYLEILDIFSELPIDVEYKLTQVR